MAITRIGAYGGPRQLYGSFVGKEIEGAGKPDGQITRIGAYGGPRQLYGDFTGKELEVIGKPDGQITRISMHGGPRGLYGDFVGKEIEIVEPPTPGSKIDYRIHRPLREQLLREDEEIMVIISAFMRMIN